MYVKTEISIPGNRLTLTTILGNSSLILHIAQVRELSHS